MSHHERLTEDLADALERSVEEGYHCDVSSPEWASLDGRWDLREVAWALINQGWRKVSADDQARVSERKVR